MNKNITSIVKTPKKPNIDAIKVKIKDAINLIGGLHSFFDEDDRVMIKPNLLGVRAFYQGITTDWKISCAVAEIFKEAGAKEVIIAEGASSGRAGGTYSTFTATGYDEIKKRTDAKLLDLNYDEVVYKKVKDPLVLGEFGIAKSIFDVDLLINVPVMKNNRGTVITASLKNMLGVLPGMIFPTAGKTSCLRVHRANLSSGIVDLNTVTPTDLVIIDGVISLEGYGPVTGMQVETDLIMAGFARATVDSVCASVMGYDPNKIEHIFLAGKRGLGVTDIDKIDVKGEPIEKVRQRFIPALRRFKYCQM